jgi:hypothetical protein
MTAAEKRQADAARRWAESQRFAREYLDELTPIADAIRDELAALPTDRYASTPEHPVPTEDHARGLVALLDAYGIEALRSTAYWIGPGPRPHAYTVHGIVNPYTKRASA